MSEEIKPVKSDKEEIIINEPEPTAEATQTVTKEDAIKLGWSKEEIKKADERGMIKKDEEKPKPEKKEEVKAEEEPKPEEKKEEPEAKQKPTKKDYELSVEEEEKFKEVFGPGHNVTGLYLGLKNQRARAQAAEMEKDTLILEIKKRDEDLRVLNERIAAIESSKKDDAGIGDENVDPEEKPVTMKQLSKFLEEKSKEKLTFEEEAQKKAERQHSALKTQEEMAKLEYPDYDKVVKQGENLIKNHLEKLEGPNRKRAYRLLQDLRTAAAKADQLKPDDYNVADIAYELGQFAESLQLETNDGANADDNGHKPDRSTGNLTPDKLKRIENNTSRRPSSASLSGSGGRRIVSPEDVTVKDVLSMDYNQRMEFKKSHPVKWRELVAQ